MLVYKPIVHFPIESIYNIYTCSPSMGIERGHKEGQGCGVASARGTGARGSAGTQSWERGPKVIGAGLFVTPVSGN